MPPVRLQSGKAGKGLRHYVHATWKTKAPASQENVGVGRQLNSLDSTLIVQLISPRTDECYRCIISSLYQTALRENLVESVHRSSRIKGMRHVL